MRYFILPTTMMNELEPTQTQLEIRHGLEKEIMDIIESAKESVGVTTKVKSFIYNIESIEAGESDITVESSIHKVDNESTINLMVDALSAIRMYNKYVLKGKLESEYATVKTEFENPSFIQRYFVFTEGSMSNKSKPNEEADIVLRDYLLYSLGNLIKKYATLNELTTGIGNIARYGYTQRTFAKACVNMARYTLNLESGNLTHIYNTAVRRIQEEKSKLITT